MTNAILVIVALCVVNKCLKVSDKQKLFALLLLILNPSIFYINYINYEIFVFAMAIISLTMYYNGHKKRSALFLCAGALANMALILVGMVMILDYLIDIVINNKGKSFKDLIMDNWKETVLYAISFLPFFINFVYINLSKKGSVLDAKNLSVTYIFRYLSYFFDPTLGFFTFAVFETIMYFVLIVLSIITKNRKALFRGGFLFAVVGGISIMSHINCGMQYCARYLIWCYPFMALFIAEELNEKRWKKKIVVFSQCLMVMSTMILFLINGNHTNYVYYNKMTVLILDHCPWLYNPYHATFYSRTLHIDGGYFVVEPAFYTDSNGSGEIRKIIFKANEKSVQRLQSELYGDNASMSYLSDQLSGKNDDKYHYINLARNGKYQLKVRPKEIELGTEIFFDNSDMDAHKYFTKGMSGTENDFAWTDGHRVLFAASVSKATNKDLTLKINATPFAHTQSVIVTSGDERITKLEVDKGGVYEIDVPNKCVKNGVLELSLELPNAISPKQTHGSADSRVLGMCIRSFVLE